MLGFRHHLHKNCNNVQPSFASQVRLKIELLKARGLAAALVGTKLLTVISISSSLWWLSFSIPVTDLTGSFDDCRGPYPESRHHILGLILKVKALPTVIFAFNRTAHIRHQCKKTIVLSYHRCLINTGIVKMNNIWI